MLIYDRATIDPGRLAVFHDIALLGYLQSHTRAWWLCDSGRPDTFDRDDLRAVLAQPRSFSPWIVVTGGSTDFAGPMPPTGAETLALLKRLGV